MHSAAEKHCKRAQPMLHICCATFGTSSVELPQTHVVSMLLPCASDVIYHVHLLLYRPCACLQGCFEQGTLMAGCVPLPLAPSLVQP